MPEPVPGPGPAVPSAPGRPIVLDDVKRDPEVEAYLTKANEYTGAIGYTEHGFRHATLVANIAGNILRRLDHDDRLVQLAAIAGYLHDIGNLVGRVGHEQTGALLASRILTRLGMDPMDMAVVMGAIGNHEELTGEPVSDACAALIIADKSDVHRTRVRNPDPATFDIHDRVNYAVEHSFLRVTSDCPLIDPEVLDRVVHALLDDSDAAFAANTLRRTYPVGLDV